MSARPPSRVPWLRCQGPSRLQAVYRLCERKTAVGSFPPVHSGCGSSSVAWTLNLQCVQWPLCSQVAASFVPGEKRNTLHPPSAGEHEAVGLAGVFALAERLEDALDGEGPIIGQLGKSAVCVWTRWLSCW